MPGMYFNSAIGLVIYDHNNVSQIISVLNKWRNGRIAVAFIRPLYGRCAAFIRPLYGPYTAIIFCQTNYIIKLTVCNS